MATQLISLRPPAASKPGTSTRGFASCRVAVRAKPSNAFSRPPASACRPSADLAGQSVAISADIPVLFDTPLARQHKLVGRWAASRGTSATACTRPEARRAIELAFNTAVLDILRPIELADLRVSVLDGEDVGSPAIAITCMSLGQLDLGWIQTSDAPIGWRAAAYRALEQSLGRVLPVFGYDDLFEEISMYYWEGETDDEAARQCLIGTYGVNPDDLDDHMLPSAMNARRPQWMIRANATAPDELPRGLSQRLSKLRETLDAVENIPADVDAWRFDSDIVYDYVPEFGECSTLPPLTLAPLEQFTREIDDVARHGMEMGFMDVAGLCLLPDENLIDVWFTSLRLGAEFLLAAQDLVHVDPAQL